MKLWHAISAMILVGCGAGKAARPDDPTASGAMNEAVCRVPAKHGTPLVVDWNAHQRVELAQAMKNGVVVLSYASCSELRVLPDCHVGELANAYSFTGIALDDELVIVDNQDQLGATFPLHAASLSGDLRRGSKIQLDLATIGGTRTIRHHASARDLVGECQGATHMLVGVDVGAFAMLTTTGASVRAGAEMFGAAAKAASTSDREHHMLAGDRNACAGVDPLRAAEPPHQCSVPLRLDVVALDDGAPNARTERVTINDDATCPAGLVLVDGLCVRASAAAHQCTFGDAADCAAQCEKNEPASCNNLGTMKAKAGDSAGAKRAYESACARNHGAACNNLGYLLETRSVDRPDEARIAGLYERACALGTAEGCTNLGAAIAFDVRKGADPRGYTRSASLFLRACEGGDPGGCAQVARSLERGEGVPRDPRRAFDLHLRLCQAGEPSGCSAAGYMLGMGTVGTKDRVQAAVLSQRGCDGRDGLGCANLATFLLDEGPMRDPARARKVATQGCGYDDFVSCDALAKMLLNGVGGPKNVPEAQRLHERACLLGRNVDWCK